MCYPPYPFESTFTIWQRLIADYAGLSVAGRYFTWPPAPRRDVFSAVSTPRARHRHNDVREAIAFGRPC